MSELPKSWDVVVVPFPYSDRHAEKRRPALIISSEALHESHGLCWLAMITSGRHTRLEGDIPIRHFRHAGLLSPCFIRPAKLAACEQPRILRIIGSVETGEREAVKAFVKSHMAV